MTTRDWGAGRRVAPWASWPTGPGAGQLCTGCCRGERAAIVELFESWGSLDRSHRTLAHRGSRLELVHVSPAGADSAQALARMAGVEAQPDLGLVSSPPSPRPAGLRAVLATGDADALAQLTATGQVPLLLASSDNGPQMRSFTTREFMAALAIAQQFALPAHPQLQDQTKGETGARAEPYAAVRG